MNSKMAKGLDYLEGEDMYRYLTDMMFCQIYASENRRIIATEIVVALDAGYSTKIETVHNYINFKDFIIRKGAVSANKDELFILPFNMEDGILLCKGKGNKEWNNSAPHGAGRIVSRAEAKKKFSAEKARKRMEDKEIYSSVIPVDEVKEAYKDPKLIEEAIETTAKIIDRIIPIMNLKEGK
jgi:RNA-splicing ligase RtcB